MATSGRREPARRAASEAGARTPGVPPHQPVLGGGREHPIDELAEGSFPGSDPPARGGPSLAPARLAGARGARPSGEMRRELIRRLPEGGAGPGAPETAEPVQGRPGAGGTARRADRGDPRCSALGRGEPSEEAGSRQLKDRPDIPGALAFLSRVVVWALVSVSQALPRPGRRPRSGRP